MTDLPDEETALPSPGPESAPQDGRVSIPTIVALGGILVAALGLRLANLGGKSLWLDEAYSVIQSQRPEVAVMGWADKVHPPFHFMLLHYWMDIFGTAEAVVRLPSVIASVLNVLLLFWLAYRLLGPRAALLAAGLLALSPLDIWYAQEARMYIFVTTAALLMALGLERDDWWGGLLLFLGLGFGLYADYLTIPIWTGLSAIWFIFWWQRGRSRRSFFIWLLASIGGWLFYQPWWAELAFFFNENLHYPFIFAEIMQWLAIERLTGMLLGLGLILATVGVLVIALLLQRLFHHPRLALPVGLAILAGFTLVTLSMLLPRIYSVKRVLVTGWPLIILLVVWIIFHLVPARRPVSVALLGVSLICSLLVIFFLPKDEWRPATTFISSQLNTEEQIWLDPSWNQIVVRYYAPNLPYQGGSVARMVSTIESGRVSAIWLIAERYPYRPVPSSESEQWLDENWVLVESIPFYNLEVMHYRPEG